MFFKLSWLVPIFYEKKYVQNKDKGGNQSKVHEAKTVENIKYEPVLRTYGLTTRKLEFEKWAKIPHREQKLTFYPAGNYMFKVNNRLETLEQSVKHVQS